MSKPKRTFITKVVQDGDDLIMPFPDSLMESMEWKEGDVLEWSVHSDRAILRKVDDPTNILRTLEGQHEVSST